MTGLSVFFRYGLGDSPSVSLGRAALASALRGRYGPSARVASGCRRHPVQLGPERLWLGHAVALSEIHADLAQQRYDAVAVHEFRDGLLAGDMTDAVDRLDHRAVDRVVGHVFDEPAIDLEEIHGQMLEIGKRGHASAEIVQREAAAQRFHCVDEVSRLVESGDSGGLCNLEADGLRPHRREVTELFAHVIEEALVADRAAGDIDGAYLEDCAAFGLLPGNRGERGANDPAIDRGHQIVAFRSRDECHGRHQLAAFIEQADQDFAVRAVLAPGVQALDVLRVEHEPVFLERLLQPADPFHLALAHRQVAVFGVIQLHAVAALFLRHVAGRVGRAHHVGQRERAVLYVHQPDADADAEGTCLPHEMEVGDGLSQLLANAQRVVRRAVLEEHAELVAPQAGERIALAQALEQHGADLAHELVAGGVTAGVVDDLELVQIEIHDCVVPALFRRTFEREAQATLEFGAIYQAGQRVVTRLVGKLGDILAFAADIAHDQDHADDLAGAGPYRSGRLYDRDFRAVV